MAGVINLICPTAKAKYFWPGDWTAQITLNRLSKSQFWRTRFLAGEAVALKKM
jgi:hypothetical protein